MVRPSTPSMKKAQSESRLNTPRTRTPLSSKSTRRFRSFMGASRENLGFAFLNEKRIARRYMSRKMRRKSMQICDSVNNLDNVTTPSAKKDFLGSVKKLDDIKVKTEEVPEASRIDIDYESLAVERRSKLEEMKQQHLDEKEVEKRKRKRKKLTKSLQAKTKYGQPRMGNHMAHLLEKIQHATGKQK